MARRYETGALKQAAKLRELQRLGAEAKAIRAAAALDARNVALDGKEREMASAEECWRASLGTMKPEIVALWSTDLLRTDKAVRHAREDAETAGAEFGRRTQESHAATARRDLAKSLALKAERRDRERRDDAALQEVLDRHALTKRDER